MYRSVLKWFVPLAVLAALTAPVYRWIKKPPDEFQRTAAPGKSAALEGFEMLRATTAKADAARQHELAVLKDQLKQNPDHAPVLLKMAEVARSMGNRKDSIDYLRQATAADPGNKEAHLELGRELFESNDVDGSIRETKLILDKDPAYVDALYNLGAIYGNLGRDELAREYFQKAVAASPDSPSGRQAKEGLSKLSSPTPLSR